MAYRRSLLVGPLFDFLRFYDEGLFTDCEIHVFEPGSTTPTVIRAHRSVLANSSEFFDNIFTSDMQEAKTGIVSVPDVRYDLVLRVVRYLYSGRLDFSEDIVMPLFSIARDFGIQSLLTSLEAYINERPPHGILDLLAQCWNHDLVDELRILVPVVAKAYTNISLQNLSSALDVVTFLEVLALLRGRTLKEQFADLEVFLGDWTCSADEKRAISAFFKNAGPEVQALFRAKGKGWLPGGFRFV
jgi:hypothetical protein